MELLNIQLNGKIIILLFFEKKILILIKGLNIELKFKLNKNYILEAKKSLVAQIFFKDSYNMLLTL